MRTIKRISHKLNRDKFAGLQEIASAYAREKQEHVGVYHDDALFGAHKSERVRRDELVKAGYVMGTAYQAGCGSWPKKTPTKLSRNSGRLWPKRSGP